MIITPLSGEVMNWKIIFSKFLKIILLLNKNFLGYGRRFFLVMILNLINTLCIFLQLYLHRRNMFKRKQTPNFEWNRRAATGYFNQISEITGELGKCLLFKAHSLAYIILPGSYFLFQKFSLWEGDKDVRDVFGKEIQN